VAFFECLTQAAGNLFWRLLRRSQWFELFVLPRPTLRLLDRVRLRMQVHQLGLQMTAIIFMFA
jgi:hypothetical protein